jgi:hypothetical protein
MCFSAAASFSAGAILIPAGVYCLTASLRKRPSTAPLAVVPLVFGIQQISEGLVWHGLEHDAAIVRPASLTFLFVALAFWPFWFPFISAVMDPRPPARRVFALLTIVSSAWFWVLFWPIVTGPDSLLKIIQVKHSIQYDFLSLEVYKHVPLTIMRVLYFSCVALPMAFGSGSLGRIPGVVFGASALVAAGVFHYAFVSVWCFIASWLSVYLCWFFWKMTNETGLRQASQESRSLQASLGGTP